MDENGYRICGGDRRDVVFGNRRRRGEHHSVVTRPIKVAQASIIGAAMGQHHLSFALQEWARPSRDNNKKPALEHRLAID
nr:hypothetical protein [Bradyrhizobium diazoefficiens]